MGLGPDSATDLGALAYSGGCVYMFGGGGAGFRFPTPDIVLNEPPLIAILYPTNKSSFFACLRIPVNAAATDPDGTVAKVEFFRGQFKLAEFTTPPPPQSPVPHHLRHGYARLL
ncbi:MAG: hypothetical protein EXS36_12630 [Pedosphaera sp.]|nr:hypothetical protein [Pedosphaera sp.]